MGEVCASLGICIHTHIAWRVMLSSSVTHQYLQQCMRMCCPVCVYITVMCLSAYVSECALKGREGGRVEGGGWGGVGV